MLKATLASLILFSLPAMADSINLLADSNWTGIGHISVDGVDSLHYSKTVPLASLSADASMGGSNGEYTIAGSFSASQGYGTGTGSASTETFMGLSVLLDLPTDSGDWLFTVNDQLNDSDHPGVTYSSCQIAVLGTPSTNSCNPLMTTHQFTHFSGIPLSISFLFEGEVDNYGESFQHQFSVSLSEVGGSAPPVTTPTPEPPSFALLGLPLVGFAIFRRHLALPRRHTISA